MENNSRTLKFCPVCGTRLAEGIKFCANCGKELYKKEAVSNSADETLATAPIQTELSQPEKAKPVQTAANVQTVSVKEPVPQNYTTAANTKNNYKTIIIVAAILVVILGISGGYYYKSVYPQQQLKTAQQHFDNKEYEKAIEACNNVIKSNDDLVVDGYILRGRAYHENNQWDKAVSDLNRAIALDQKNKEAAKYREYINNQPPEKFVIKNDGIYGNGAEPLKSFVKAKKPLTLRKNPISSQI